MLVGLYAKVIANILGIGSTGFTKNAQWHSDKTAKTGFVGFGIIYLGGYREFFGGIFLCIAGVVGFIEGPFFHRSALIAAMVCKGGAMPSITWAWGRDDQRPVFTAYRSLDGRI